MFMTHVKRLRRADPLLLQQVARQYLVQTKEISRSNGMRGDPRDRIRCDQIGR
jgi:hypothetical protein